jgi:hypothetical protein
MPVNLRLTCQFSPSARPHGHLFGKKVLSLLSDAPSDHLRIALFVAAVSLVACTAVQVSADQWTDRFLDPPASAGMTVYWIWFGPSASKESIDRDLSNMRQAHISGATILPVYDLHRHGHERYGAQPA